MTLLTIIISLAMLAYKGYEKYESNTGKFSYGVIDLVAYAGGISYFISHIVFGPVVRNLISKRLFIAEIGKELFYKYS